MIRPRPALAVIVSLLASPAFADDPASVAVQTEAPRQGVVPDLVIAYGSAAPALDGGMTLSIQQEGRVLAMAVTPGETVHAGERLLDFTASAAAVASYQQAVSALSAARQQRGHTAQLLGQQLATRDQLAQADKALADAQATLDALQREGADRPSRTLTAPFDGIIATIPVAQGDRVPLGATLMTITRLDGLVVTVGVEPGARAGVHPGEAVHLEPLAGGAALDGQVLRVDGMLNPRTRLVDADVSVPAGSVISGAAFRAAITVGELRGWIVPHDAVLSDASGTYVFQVAGTTAARVDVKVAGAAGADDVVQGALDPQRPIVVQGNYQLSDKTPVRMSDASPPSTSQTDARPTSQADARPTNHADATSTSPANATPTSPANATPHEPGSMNFAAFVERHARSIILVGIALAVAGMVSAISLPVGLFPQVAFPRVVVDLDAGSRPADQTALLVTRPVEEAIRTVPGVLDVRSASSRGAAQISVDFGWGRDMVGSTLLVDAAISQILPNLPPGTAYNVRRMDPTVFPIISYALLSDTVSPVALHDLAQYQIVPLLSSIAGLARVDVQGGATAEVEVLADPHRLAGYGLGLTDLSDALAKANVLQAVGQLQDNHKLYLVTADHSIDKTASIGDVVVRSDPAGVVRVRDVATVQDGVVPQWIRVVEDGKPAVLFNVYEQPDGNAVQIAGAVRAKLASFKLPQGVRMVNWYDQSELVTQSAGSVRDAVLIGLVLAALVLILFLRSWRVTLIAVLVVPATLASAVLVLSVLGMSFNIMTLGGIAAAVGLLIDDVIVMVEHIARRAGVPTANGGVAGNSAVLPASREFLRPLTGSSLATLIVFLPLSFLSGVTGAFSKALSITMAAALAISYLMTAFIVPVLARALVDFDRWRDPAGGHDGAGNGWLARQHGRLLDSLFRRPWLFGFALVPLLVVGWFAYNAVPTGFMPAVDEGGFVMDYFTPAGTSLTETSREVGEIDAMLGATPEVATFSRRLGTGLGGDLGESYHGDYFVRLKPNHARSTPDVMAAVLAEVQAKVPGVDVELAQLMEDLIGDLTAVPQPIEIKLFATDPAALIPQAEKVAAAIGKVDGVVEVKSGVRLAGDALDLRIDPVRAGIEGVTPDDVSRAVDAALTGTVATQLPRTTKTVGVRVRLPDALRLRQTALAELPIRAADGHIFPLRRVASLVPVTGQPEISRDNLQPMIAVTGRIEGRGIGAAVADVQHVLGQPNMLGSGVRYELGGLYQQQQIAFAGLVRVFAAALVAEFILLLFLYERVWLPVIIIVCSLLSTTSVFTALWLTGVELNITALMGMTMIIGIGTEMAIFYVSEYAELAHHMDPRRALREASRNRLRPITMTTLAAILTLMPLALALGQGAAIQQPLAISIIAGLLLQFPLVLLVMPVLIGLTIRDQPGNG